MNLLNYCAIWTKDKKRENLKHFEGYMLVMINKTMGEPLWGDILLWIENMNLLNYCAIYI